MELVHSKLTEQEEPPKKAHRVRIVKRSSFAERAQYRAYKKELKEWETDIKEIQQTIPGWMPQYNKS